MGTLTLSDSLLDRINRMAEDRHCAPETVVGEALEALGNTFEEDRQELYRLLDEGRADVLAGRTCSWEEAMNQIQQDLKNGTL